jgi:hypothetical protein
VDDGKGIYRSKGELYWDDGESYAVDGDNGSLAPAEYTHLEFSVEVNGPSGGSLRINCTRAGDTGSGYQMPGLEEVEILGHPPVPHDGFTDEGHPVTRLYFDLDSLGNGKRNGTGERKSTMREQHSYSASYDEQKQILKIHCSPPVALDCNGTSQPVVVGWRYSQAMSSGNGTMASDDADKKE